MVWWYQLKEDDMTLKLDTIRILAKYGQDPAICDLAAVALKAIEAATKLVGTRALPEDHPDYVEGDLYDAGAFAQLTEVVSDTTRKPSDDKPGPGYMGLVDGTLPGDFPASVTVDDDTYDFTGKVGTNRCNGLPAAEYANEHDARVWYRADGVVERD